MFRFCINLFLTLWLSLLTGAAIQSHRAADWSGVKGLTPAPAKEPVPEILERMEQAVWRRNAPLELSEADVNHYLAHVIAGRQGSVTEASAHFERVALDFEPGVCKACFAWQVAGRFEATAVLEFTVERQGANFVIEPRRGAFGHLPVYRGMMCALMPALGSLCTALDDEIHTVFQMNQLHFGKDTVTLDPRSDSAK